MTNTNLPDHWTPTELVGAPAYLQRAAKDYAEAYALAALAQSGQGEAVLYVAQAQLDGLLSGTLPGCQNLGAERGVYLPVRPEAGGKFTAPLYTRPQPAQPARVVDAFGVMLSDEVIEAATLAHEESNCHDLIGPMSDAMKAAVACARKLSTPTAAPTPGSITSMQHPMNPGGFQDCGFGPTWHDYAAAPTPSQAAPCKGMNCGCTDGVNHSLECQAEHAAAITGGKGGKQQAELRAALWHIKNTAISLADAQVIALEALAAYAKKEGCDEKACPPREG